MAEQAINRDRIIIVQPEGDSAWASYDGGAAVEASNIATHQAAGDDLSEVADVLELFRGGDDCDDYPQTLDGWRLVDGPNYVEGEGDYLTYERGD